RELVHDLPFGFASIWCDAGPLRPLQLAFLDDPLMQLARALDAILIVAITLGKLANDLVRALRRVAIGKAATEPDALPRTESVSHARDLSAFRRIDAASFPANRGRPRMAAYSESAGAAANDGEIGPYDRLIMGAAAPNSQLFPGNSALESL